MFGALALVFSAAGPGGMPALGLAPVRVWLGVRTLVGVVNAGLLYAVVAWARGVGGCTAA